MNKLCYIAILLFSTFFGYTAYAAEFYFSPQNISIPSNGSKEITFNINTQGENINAVEGKVLVSGANVLEVKNGGSIVGFWANAPKTGNEINFSGVIPSGYNGDSGKLFSIVINNVNTNGTAMASGVKALLNDGLGTEASILIKSANLTSYFVAGENKTIDNQIDQNPPEEFAPAVAKNPDIYKGQYFLVFSTQDKDSGLVKYEVKEGDNDFSLAESPYLLKDQSLTKPIVVKAVDKAGNERLALVAPINSNLAFKVIIYIILAAVLVICLLLLTKKIKKLRKQ